MVGTYLERHTYGDGRIYTDEKDIWLPSVSWVLDVREKPQQLINYEKRTSEAEKKWTKFYTQNRGTLIHWHLLSQLDEDLPWTEDEESSEQCLRGNRVHEETGLTGDYETWMQFQDDLEWAKEAWEYVCMKNSLGPDNTRDVELFVTNEQVGYAGQFDLLYNDGPDIVLADIKTGKFVYDKNLLQSVAYSHAVDVTVDRLEILRMNPDGKTWEVSSSDNWKESREDLWDEFVDLRERFDEQQIEELKKRVQDEL